MIVAAAVEPRYIHATPEQLPNGVGVLVVSLSEPDYASYRALPDALRYESRLYGKSGWNSDTGLAYYRTDWPLAEVAR